MYIKELEKNKYRVFLEGGKDYKGGRKRPSKVFTAKTKKDLNRKIDEWSNSFEFGTNKGSTVADMCASVFPLVCKGKSENTIYGYENCRKRIEKSIGKAKLHDLTPQLIQTWLDHFEQAETISSKNWRTVNSNIKKKTYSAKTIKETYSVLRLCCSVAVRWRLLKENPCHDIVLPVVHKQEAKILTADSFVTFFQNLDSLDLDTRVLFEVALFGSLRRGEALAMLDEDITGNRIKIDSARYLLRNKREYLKGVKTPAGDRFCVLPSFVLNDIKTLRK